MSKSLNQSESATNTQPDEVQKLLVTAAVTVRHSSGTDVEAPTMGAAIKLIRSQVHDDVPLVSLDGKHQNDPLFSGAVTGWLIADEHIIPLKDSPATYRRDPDYVLTYHTFAISDPTAPGAKTPCKPDALIPVATKAAEASGSPVMLYSKLLGFQRPTFHPGDAAALQAKEESSSESVLASLESSLFTGDTSGPRTILVHPPEPTRSGNVVIIRETTGVVYNAEPGEYPIDGAGISVVAEPATGYEFPDGVTTTWDFERWEDPELTVQDSAIHGLEEIVDEAESATDTAVSEAAEQAADEAEPSTALVVRKDTTPPTPFMLQRRVQIIGGAVLLALVVLGLWWFFSSGSEAEEPAIYEAEWVSTPAELTPAEESLTEDHTATLWDLDAEDAEELSWYQAGVAHIDFEDDALVLLATLTGEETARVALDEPVEWTTEFMAGDTAAVGARTESGFIALTSDGDTQTWDIAEDSTLRVSGSTPMVITADDEIFALIVDEEDPVAVTGNPEYRAAAIDGETLIQFAAGVPRVVSLPITDDADLDSAELVLSSPAEGASFSRHLSVGHGFTLTEWHVDGEDFLVVHDLTEDATVTAVVPAVGELGAWSIGRGMDLAVVGPYAFSLDTGELVAESPAGNFVSALGPVPVYEGDTGREFILDSETYHEASRVIGYTGAGTALVRNPDGSVSAVEESSGTA